MSTEFQTPNPPTEGDSAVRPRSSSQRGGLKLEHFERHGLVLVFVLTVVLFSLLRPDTFATAANWRSIATTQAVPAILAVALLPTLLCGRFDVSIGANMAACALVSASVMSQGTLPLAGAVVVAILVGGAIGLFNGFLVAYLGVNSIVGTLAVSTIIGGIAIAKTDAIPISSNIPSSLISMSISTFLGVPIVILIAIAASAATWFILTQTPFGRRLTATGVNLSAARLSGMRVNLLVMSSFAFGGLLAGVAGVVSISVNGAADPSVASIGAVIPSLAAAFLGATTWTPGRYNVPGTFIALFFIGATTSGLALLGTEPWVSDVFNGGVVVVAVVISGQIHRRRTGNLEIGA